VWQRHPSELLGTCQPLAARQDRDLTWEGYVRDISRGGLSLVLKRRFEAGTALVLEVTFPGAREPQSLLLKVTNVRALPGNEWALGCSFLSRLSEERLQRMLGRGLADEAPPLPAPQPPPAPPAETNGHSVLQDVLFEGPREGGGPGNFRARRLYFGSGWPFTEGTTLTLGLDARAETAARLRIRVTHCGRRGAGWVITYELAEKPSAEVQRLFRRSGA
jgi:hypothetical protein